MIMRHITGESKRQLEANKTKEHVYKGSHVCFCCVWICLDGVGVRLWKRGKRNRECVCKCVSSSKPHVGILLGKTGMQKDEKQMWWHEEERRRRRGEREEEGSVTKKRLVTIGGSEGNILSTNLYTKPVFAQCTHLSVCCLTVVHSIIWLLGWKQ